jgi:hypothetical protein
MNFNKLWICLLVVLVAAGGYFVVQGTIFANSAGQAASSDIDAPPSPSVPLMLNTIAYAEQIVNSTISVPNVSVLGSGFRVIGVQIQQRPTTTTQSNGPSYINWSVVLYITNQTFVNGSTPSTDAISSGIFVVETPQVPGTNSYDTAEADIQPGQACVVANYNTSSASSSCSQMQGPTKEIIQVGDTYVVVTQSAPNAFFLINGTGPEVSILPASTPPAMSYQQLLALVRSMLPSTSTSNP